jgi:hypothetical protein
MKIELLSTKAKVSHKTKRNLISHIDLPGCLAQGGQDSPCQICGL